MKLSKQNAPKKSGGKRNGAGAKPKGDAPNYNSFSFRPTNEAKEILSKQPNKSAFINEAILSYNENQNTPPRFCGHTGSGSQCL